MGMFSSDDRVGGFNLLRELAATATGFAVKAQTIVDQPDEGKVPILSTPPTANPLSAIVWSPFITECGEARERDPG